MKKIVDVSYECDICHRRWNRAKDARTCETSPRPALRPGDVVLRAGSRDDQYGALQSLVVDVVKEIELEMRGPTPGHEPRYTLTKENSVHQRDIVSPRRGYLNVTQGAFYVLHDETNFTLADMRKEKKGKASAAFKYLGKTLDWDRRIANCYEALRDVQYSGTWHGNPNVYHLRRLLPEDAQVLAAITLEPTDETIYELLGMRRYDDSKYVIDDQYSDPQDFYHAFFHWGFLVKHDLWRAFDLMTRPLDEIVAFVRDYRARILRGELPAPSKGDFARKLFKPNPVFAKKSWGTEVNAWAIKNNIKGGVSQRRLISAWETALTAKGEEEEFTMKTMKLFEGKKVIAIGSGKGGVGKSTVAADLARALVAEGKKVLMVDLDLGGSSQHLLFPVKKKESRLKTHDGKIVPHVVDGVEVVSFGYILESSEALTLRGPHLESAFHALASHIESNADIVVIDMPPGSSDLPLALEDFCPQTLYLVVATAGDVALADVRRMLSTLKSGSRSRIIGLIENMAYIEHNGERIALFGDKHDVARLAAEFNLPILCTLPLTARENRIALLRQEILPTLFHSLEAGVSYQKVSNKIIADEVKRLVNEWRERRDENKAESGITHVTSRSNILTELRYIITTQGGNPDDKQYQHVLTKGVAAVARAAGKYCSGKEL